MSLMSLQMKVKVSESRNYAASHGQLRTPRKGTDRVSNLVSDPDEASRGAADRISERYGNQSVLSQLCVPAQNQR